MAWIIIATSLLSGVCTAGGIYMGIFLSGRKKDRLHEKLSYEREKKLQDARRKNLHSAYFELKVNIFILSSIQELIRNKNFDQAVELLKGISVERACNLSKNIKLNRSEFDVVDELYLPRLFKSKISFQINLCMEDKLNLLELRADVEKFTVELMEIEKKFKDVFIEKV